MASNDRLEALFRAVLELPDGADVTACRQGVTPTWDSMAHVTLVAAMEGEFGLAIDAADSLSLTSYEAARQYLAAQGR